MARQAIDSADFTALHAKPEIIFNIIFIALDLFFVVL